MAVHGPGGGIVVANEAFASLVGDEATWVDLDFIHPDYREDAIRALREHATTGRASEAIRSKIVGSEGEIRSVEVSVSEPVGEPGEGYVLVVLRDVTREAWS